MHPASQIDTQSYEQAVNAVTEAVLTETANAMGVLQTKVFTSLIKRMFRKHARNFAEVWADFDRGVAHHGVPKAAKETLRNFITRYRIHGEEHIPSEGPLLVTANHPGVYDSVLLSAVLKRKDIVVMASLTPILSSLRHLSEHLVFVDKAPDKRALCLRAAIRHLGEGGTLLIFPHGSIEPDPAVLPGAKASLDEWSDSLALMVRRVPQVQVLVSIVQGVLHPKSLHHLLPRLQKEAWKQRRAAEFIQVLQQMALRRAYDDLLPEVSFASPVLGSVLYEGIAKPSSSVPIIARAHKQLDAHMALPESAWELVTL